MVDLRSLMFTQSDAVVRYAANKKQRRLEMFLWTGDNLKILTQNFQHALLFETVSNVNEMKS